MLGALALLSAVGGEAMAEERARKVTNLQELRQERSRLAHRTRRIIFNNDGNEPVYYLKEATAKELLDCRTTALKGTHVDSIFYCTWSSGFGYFTHRTKVGQIFDRTDNPEHPDNKGGGLSRNKTAEFIRQGTDPLEIMVDFCKENGIEVFWSLRMNDTHDAWGSWYGDLLFPQVKKDHPEWLVASKEKRSKHGGWSAMDFGHAEVRDLTFRFFEEVCENYDVDGIEMDFCRHPVYFKNPAWGIDAGPTEWEQMTEMVRRVREMTERVGLKRGRPILVAARVPDSVEYCKAMGLDLERWLQEGLIDLLAVSDYFRLNPWKVSVDLGRKYGVPVYPCLSETRMRDDEARKTRSSIECYRSRAMNAWAAGASGIYLFNSFNPRSPLWSELGDPKVLETLDKVYVIGARGVAVLNFWMADGEKRFMKRPTLSPERPVALKPGEAFRVPLEVGEEVREKAGATPRVTLQVRVAGLPEGALLQVTLNDKPLSGAVREGDWFTYTVAPAAVRKGTNEIETVLQPDTPDGAKLLDVLLWVRYNR